MFDPVAYINEPRWHNVSLGLDRIRELLDLLGNPQQGLRFVHVAGTNGKGSTCAFTARILQEAGYCVGLFTSPYIMCFEERIRVNGENISLEDLTAVTLRVREAAESMAEHPTEFELMTAVAFAHFAEQNCDIVVAEVGLGGRLDSTNAIETVEVSAIAPIAFDHRAMLGNTLAEIAGEKAGIIKPEVPVVSAPQEEEVAAVLRTYAQKQSAPLRFVDAEQVHGTPEDFAYGAHHNLVLSLTAAYQCFNAALAIEICETLKSRGWNIPEEALRKGLANTSWPGRFEVVRRNPDVILDGAHNIQGCQALVAELQRRYPSKQVLMVLGLLEDKDYHEMVEILVPAAKVFYCVTPPNPRALPAHKLAQTILWTLQDTVGCAGCIRPYEASTIKEGITQALTDATEEDIVVICGSLYSLGEAKQTLI